ncbi:MAG TPA: hypothetical protein EYP79_04410 [Campylobacterales bacterium]|nr:hypothetical protein [Campylobacterales bacterium]
MMTKITSQIKFIGGTLSLVIVAIVASVIYINQKSKNDSIVVNIAGKQRMLTQKISKEVFRLKTAKDIDLSELNEALALFDKNLKSLIKGDKKKGIFSPPTQEIKEQLQKVEELWIQFKKRVKKFKELILKIEVKKSFVITKNEQLLKISDRVVKEMVNLNIDPNFVDIAGRQRMLSQRMIYFLLLYLNDPEPKYYKEFYETLNLYDSTLKKFITIEKNSLKNILKENNKFWQDYSAYLKDLIELQKELNSIVNYIYQFNNVLLNGMDQAVSMYAIYSQKQRTLLENIENTLAFIAFLIIFYSYFLIRNIQKHFEKFLEKSKTFIVFDKEHKVCENGDEFTIASKRLESFIQEVDRMIIDAQKAIKTSEYLAKELSDVSEIFEKNVKEKGKIEKYLNRSEDIAIQSLEDLEKSAKLLQKLHENLSNILKETKK